MASIYKIIIIVGFISLFHSAFSAAQHRSYLRITSQEFTTLPLDIIIQAVTSLFTVMWGVLNVSGKLREIQAAAELNNMKWETQKNLQSFYIFNHRGIKFNCTCCNIAFSSTINSNWAEIEEQSCDISFAYPAFCSK